MFRRRLTRSRTALGSSQASASVEHLEPRELLSQTRVFPVSDDSAGDVRKITITDIVAADDRHLSIEEVHAVNGELWVLTSTRPIQNTGLNVTIAVGDQSSSLGSGGSQTATISIRASEELPVRVFRINPDEGSTAIPVSGYRDFHQRLRTSDAIALFERVDPELSEWRERSLAELVEQADKVYGGIFGQESDSSYWYLHATPFEDGSFANVARAISEDSVDLSLTYSDTNNQVVGVDEADIVETDGTYLYILSGSELVIVQAAGEGDSAVVVSRTQLPTDVNSAMHLHDGRLTIVSRKRLFPSYLMGTIYGSPDYPGTIHRVVVSVFDVTDPASPALRQETETDGVFESSRAIGSDVYVVVKNTTGVPHLPAPWSLHDKTSSTDFRTESRELYIGRLREQVESMEPPTVYRRSTPEGGHSSLQRLGWLDGTADETDIRNSQLTTVLHFDSSRSEFGLVDDISIRTSRYSNASLYASHNAIYLASVEHPLATQDRIFVRTLNSEASVRINKIDISGDKLRFDGAVTLPGTIESQFSLDEHKGYLRVVTTTRMWADDSENQVHILEDKGDALEVVGSITGLAIGERVYSVRFDGDRAWMVTFRAYDPVFTLDLSNPTSPKVAGELKIPGYSEYLQLIDEDHLLAIGRDATETGVVGGVQISLFDISDMSAPKLLHRRLLTEAEDSWGNSTALRDHHAFNYLPDSSVLLIPYRDTHGSRLVSLKVSAADGIDIIAQLASTATTDLQRGMQVGEFLYAIGRDNVAVAALSDPGKLLYDVQLNNPAQARQSRSQLLASYSQSLSDRLDLREYVREDGERIRQLEFGGLFGLDDFPFDDLLDIEFVVRDARTGVEVLRQQTDRPWLRLNQDGQNVLETGVYEFQVRTRVRFLENSEWAVWIRSDVVTIGDDEAEMISRRRLPEAAPVLEWSEIADAVDATNGVSADDVSLNPVDHYEVWITDVTLGHMVIYDRNVPGTHMDLGNLGPGQYHAWFRGIYQDGEPADWSRRTAFEILGHALPIQTSIVTSADSRPEFKWDGVASAESYEVEIVYTGGASIVYFSTGLHDTGHKVSGRLRPGQYTFRVRALLQTGVPTEWAEHQFRILDRPEITVSGRRMELIGVDTAFEPGAQETVEIWITKSGTSERVFHDADWNARIVGDVEAIFGLKNKVGKYDVWTRLVGATNSKWSNRQTFEVFHDAVTNLSDSASTLGQLQTFSWEPVEAAESYEIFIRQVGQTGAVFERQGIVGDSLTLPVSLARGTYEYWLRGRLSGDRGFTRWTRPQYVSVKQSVAPVLALEGDLVKWEAPEAAVRHHLWVNRVDSSGFLIQARIAHFEDLTAMDYGIGHLPDGNYSAWVQSYIPTARGLFETQWSERLDFQVSTISDIFDSTTGDVNEVISVLDDV